MIAEIVSNGMLSLPQALATVGIVPGVILIVFLGVFATFTSWVLIQFKLRHPEVHNMGDAGYILAGPIGREVLAAGTVIFAVFATGSQLLAGQIALSELSDGKLCLMLYTGEQSFPPSAQQLMSNQASSQQLPWSSPSLEPSTNCPGSASLAQPVFWLPGSWEWLQLAPSRPPMLTWP